LLLLRLLLLLLLPFSFFIVIFSFVFTLFFLLEGSPSSSRFSTSFSTFTLRKKLDAAASGLDGCPSSLAGYRK
jgi:hypothetical protein